MKNECLAMNTPSFGCIPRHLDVQGREELSVFPGNVVFASMKGIGTAIIGGYSVYEPDIDSFTTAQTSSGETLTLMYHNTRDPKYRVEIDCTDGREYEGRKYVDGDQIVKAFGSDWRVFFYHLTFLGLSDGEACVMERL